MKFRILIFLCLTSIVFSKTILSIHPHENQNYGDIQFSIIFENSKPISGLQFQIKDQLAILDIDSVITTGRMNEFTLLGKKKVILFNLMGELIPASTDTILTFFGKLDSTTTTIIDTLKLTDILVVDSLANEISTETVDGVIEINNHNTKISDNLIPQQFTLFPNYPNPFNANTNIVFTLPHTSKIDFSIYNQLGKKIHSEQNLSFSNGTHTISFNATHLPSGIYYFTLSNKTQSLTQKMVLIK